MRVFDPGHKYKLISIDGDTPQYLTFVKREGDKYPFNIGHYPGTNIQEICRVLIDRTAYLDSQHYCPENSININLLRQIIYNLEQRAAREHGVTFRPPAGNIEGKPACKICGHIFEHTHEP